MQVKVRAAGVVAASLCILTVGACSKPAEDPVDVIRPIKILTVMGGAAGRGQTYAGVIESGSTADIGFEVSGRIVEMLVTEGQEVRQGELLARLDPADFQSGVDKASADYRAAEATFRRYEELVSTGSVSRQDLDTQRRTFEVSAAGLDTAKKALADTRLLAPFAGNVGRTYVENFSNVAAKEPVVLVQDLSNLEVVVAVPEQDWAKARPRSTFAESTARFNPVVSLATFPGRGFPLAFTEVATVADPVTRTFEIRFSLQRPDDIAIMPGMTASVQITPPADVIADDAPIVLPAAAVFGNDDGGSSVWLVDSSSMTVSEAVVQLGALSPDGVDVVAGIVAGDRVAVSGVGNLREGMQVREYVH